MSQEADKIIQISAADSGEVIALTSRSRILKGHEALIGYIWNDITPPKRILENGDD